MVLLLLSACAPTGSSSRVTLSPVAPTTQDDLHAELPVGAQSGLGGGARSPEFPELELRWFVDDQALPTWDDALAIPASETARGQRWRVELREVWDAGPGPWTQDEVVIQNAAPLAPTVEVSPSEPMAGTHDLLCRSTSELQDPDDDPLTLSFSWTRDGSPVEGEDEQAPGDRIPNSWTSTGEIWTCIASVSDGEETVIATAQVEILPPPPLLEFSSCGLEGPLGPTQEDCDLAYGESGQGVVVVDGIQHWVVPASGRYRITARGAQGAGARHHTGGQGAELSALFDLEAGQELQLLVGQIGEGDGLNTSAGGGGASWVALDGSTLLVAAGGGGSSKNAAQPGCDGGLDTLGQTGSGEAETHDCALRSGGEGQGGGPSAQTTGAGGGGLESAGAADFSEGGGQALLDGGLGGQTSEGCGNKADGGFGGGGSGRGCFGAGGGGGYSGGDGGVVAGGGGSFSAGEDTQGAAGSNAGAGGISVVLEP